MFNCHRPTDTTSLQEEVNDLKASLTEEKWYAEELKKELENVKSEKDKVIEGMWIALCFCIKVNSFNILCQNFVKSCWTHLRDNAPGITAAYVETLHH